MADYLASIFGTEKDKVNCSFYFKIGACRHGERCSRIHNKPTFSQTILLQNLYQNPQNVTQTLDAMGKVETTIQRVNTMSEEDAQEHFDDFFEDVFVELEDKYGEIEEMNVCDNLGDHLVGNVYVKFRSEEDAERAVNELSNRWFGGRPIHAELSPVTDFREACCRQYEMGECTRSGFCNFMHLKPISRELRRELYGRRRAAALERRIASYIGGGADRSITANTTRRGGGIDLERSPFGRDDYSRSSRDRDRERGDRGDRGGRGGDRGDRGDSKRHGSRDRDSRRRRRSGSREAGGPSKRRRSRSRSKDRSKKHGSSSSRSRSDRGGGDRDRGDRGDPRADRGGGGEQLVKLEIEEKEEEEKVQVSWTENGANDIVNAVVVKPEPKDDEDVGNNSSSAAPVDDYGSYNPAPPPLPPPPKEEWQSEYADHQQSSDSYSNGGAAGGEVAGEEDSQGYGPYGGGGGHYQQQQQNEDLEEHYRQQLQQQQQQFNNGANAFAEGAPVKAEGAEEGDDGNLYNEDSNSNSNSNSNQMMANYGYTYQEGEEDD